MKPGMPTLLIALGAIFGAVVFVSTAETLFKLSDTEVPVPFEKVVVRETGPGDFPARLRIPALDVDAEVQEVGITAQGNMAAPTNFVDVGWYKHGTLPGFLGSAVITGHLDNALALDGVFKRLAELEVGDDVYIEREDGTELHFRVVETKAYPYTEVPLRTLFSRRDTERLNLITCDGTWLPSERSYDERLVIYTELISG